MPVALTVEGPSTFVVPASGIVTYFEVIEVIEKLLERVSELPGARILVDGEEVTATPRVIELAGIARAIKPLIQSGVARIAIVANTELVYQAARAFCIFAELVGACVSVFREASEARAWLGEK